MSSGPTQNYDDATLGLWKPHPALAMCVRVLVVALPPLGAIAFGLASARWASAERLGMDLWVWLAAEIAVSTVLLLVAGRACRRLLPLSTLLRLTVYFPDQAPTRFDVARRHYSPQVLRERVEAMRGRDGQLGGEHHHAALLLDLVAAIGEHDHTTRGHSERVQAYAALIGRELGLSARDSAKLSWAALLHDVGKLRLQPELLNKNALPTDEEWEILSTHPLAGMEITQPLAAWLGPWTDAIGQHHERWDGGGYPRGLAGDAISRGARIVAVADAYDVITSARAYKKPLTASAARAELTRCSGQQFDPEVVRAFLALGLGRLRVIAGPASMLSALPGLGSTPMANLASLTSGVTTVVTTAAAVAVAGAIGAGLALSGLVADAARASGSTQSSSDAVADRVASSTASPRTSPTTSPTSLPSAQPTADAAPLAAAPLTAAPLTAAPPTAAPPTAAPLAAAPPTAAPSTAAPSAGVVPAGAVPSTGSTPQEATAPTPAASTTAPDASPCARAIAGATSLEGADLAGCDLAGLTLTGDYSDANLVGADLSGATLTMLDLSGAKLNAATLDGATISATSFDHAELTGASFVDATITGSSFVGASLAPTTLRDAQVSSCTFE
jgi:hypothetical protein